MFWVQKTQAEVKYFYHHEKILVQLIVDLLDNIRQQRQQLDYCAKSRSIVNGLARI